MLGPPFGTTSERNLNSLFIMNSAGEEDEGQVDSAGIPDSGNRESRFCRDRENNPRCPGIGDFGVWLRLGHRVRRESRSSDSGSLDCNLPVDRTMLQMIDRPDPLSVAVLSSLLPVAGRW